MNRLLLQYVSIAVISCYLLGCATTRATVGVEHPTADGLLDVAGGVTYVHVLEKFGPPEKISSLEEGFVMMYEYISVLSKGWTIPLNVINIGVMRGNMTVSYLTLTFDKDSMLSGVATREETFPTARSIGTKNAKANLPLFIEELLNDSEWGVSMLRELHRTIAYQQDMDGGSAGLELIGTPQDVGQRTLETQETVNAGAIP